MKLREIRNDYYEASGKVSELVRSLSYSCIAVVWVIKTGDKKWIDFDPLLLWVLLFSCLALGFDFSQYVVKTYVWGKFNDEQHKKGVKLDDEVEVSNDLNVVARLLFRAKITACSIGVIIMIVCIMKQISFLSATG
jgi:hypothetical protein